MKNMYRVCTRCIMDTSDRDITFDEEGVCNYCKNYFFRLEHEVFKGMEREERLNAIVSKIKLSGKNKKYDCIAGLSGGVDSTFTMLNLKKLGLRPLVVHLDNGWNSELAVDNIDRTLKMLGFDLYTHVIDWEEFREIQLSFLKASVINCEVPTDHAIHAILFNVAEQMRVRYIIGGGNIATEGIMPDSWSYNSLDLKNIKAIHRRFGKIPIKTMPTISLYRFFYLVVIKKLRIIPILNYLSYNKKEATEIIKKELGWREYGSKHFESIYTRFYQGYILKEKFNIDKRRAHLSTLVCSKEMTRAEALEELTKDSYSQYNLKEDKDYVLKKFGLSEEEFQTIIKNPMKEHTDYPNDAFILYKLANLRNKFKKIATGIE